jgi:hypothetical protein
MSETLTTCRAGAITMEPPPEWWPTTGAGDWPEMLKAAGCDGLDHFGEEFGLEVEIYATPGGGRYVEVWGSNAPVLEIHVPEPADWPAAFAAHVLPAIRAASELETVAALRALKEVALSFARHGGGEHIDRHSGESNIDRRRDMAEWQRRKAAGQG